MTDLKTIKLPSIRISQTREITAPRCAAIQAHRKKAWRQLFLL